MRKGRSRGSHAKLDSIKIDLPFEKAVEVLLSVKPKKKPVKKKKVSK
ncbi:MAG: hypothetical protein NTZ17_10395 [Phycisphaerae bacterium]|nr:hypothetical protein [Phycisphaerae bacterium]